MKFINSNIFKFLFASSIFLFTFFKLRNEISSINWRELIKILGSKPLIYTAGVFLIGCFCILILCMYDFIIIKEFKTVHLSLSKLLKISWIANSFNVLLGFGGIIGANIRYNFYKLYINDNEKSKLKKAISLLMISTISGVGLLSLLVVCNIFNNNNLLKNNISLKTFLFILVILLPIYLIYITIKPPIIDAKWLGLKLVIVSSTDYLTSGIVMYTAMKFMNINISFIDMESIFIIATIAGIISMVPGGLGAFDLIFLLGVTQELNIEKSLIVSALVLYRISYYFVPFAIGLVLSVSELQHTLLNTAKESQITILSKEIGTIVFSITQQQIKQLGRSLTVIIFSFISFYFISDSLLLLIGNEQSIYLYFVVLLTLCCSTLIFTDSMGIIVGSKETYNLLRIKLFFLSAGEVYLFYQYRLLLGIILVLFLWIAWAFLKKITEVTVIKTSITEKVTWIMIYYLIFDTIIVNMKFMQNYQILCTFIALLICIVFSYLKRQSLRSQLTLDLNILTKEETLEVFSKIDGNNLAHLALLEDNQVSFDNQYEVGIIFQETPHTIFVLGDPLGNKKNIFPFLKKLLLAANQKGKEIIFYQTSTNYLEYFNDLDYKIFKLGEEGTIDLTTFSLSGKKKRGFRATLNQLDKFHYKFQIVYPPYSTELLRELQEVSDKWLDTKKEMSFSVGNFEENYLNKAPIGILKDEQDHIIGFVSIMPTYNDETISIDLIRWDNSYNLAAMDALYLKTILWAKDEGYLKFNIGMAPFSNSHENNINLKNTIITSIYSNTNYLYSFRGLRNYKEKYKPSWSSKYLIYNRKVPLFLNLYSCYKLIHSSKP